MLIYSDWTQTQPNEKKLIEFKFERRQKKNGKPNVSNRQTLKIHMQLERKKRSNERHIKNYICNYDFVSFHSISRWILDAFIVEPTKNG